MASVVNDPIGRKRILFVGLDRVRRAIRLGRCGYGQAVSFCRHVESLLTANILGEAFNPITATSLSRLSPKLRQPLAVVGLVEPEKQLTTEGSVLSGDFLLRVRVCQGKRPHLAASYTCKSTLDCKGTVPRVWSSSDDERRTRSPIARASKVGIGSSAGSSGISRHAQTAE